MKRFLLMRIICCMVLPFTDGELFLGPLKLMWSFLERRLWYKTNIVSCNVEIAIPILIGQAIHTLYIDK